MTAISSGLSNKMTNMSLIAAMFVVVLHADVETSAVVPVSWLYTFTKYGVGYLAMPWFFFASGFFLMNRFDSRSWYKTAICRRLKSLVVPYCVWCLFAVVVIHCLSVAGLTNYKLPYKSLSQFVNLTFGLTCHLPLYGPMWYLRDLFVCVVFSPLLIFGILRWPIACLVVTGAAGWASRWLESTCGLPYYFLYSAVPLELLFYFALGIAVRLFNVSLSVPRGVAALLCIGFLVLCVCVNRYGIVVTLWPMKALGVVGVWGLMSGKRWPRWLTESQFPLYVLHWLLLILLTGIFRRLGLQGECAYPVLTVCTCATCVGASVCMHKACPRLSAIVFGGR